MAQSSHKNLTEAAEARGGLKAVCNSPAFRGVLILVVTLLAYSSVFSAGFNWDDDDHVIRIASLVGRGLAHAAAGAVDRARADLTKARELGYPLDDGQIGRILSSARQ